MQIYLKPPYRKKAIQVPYPAGNGQEELGYVDLKGYPHKAKMLPELKNNPELKNLISAIHNHELYSFSCSLFWDPFLQATGFYEFSTPLHVAFEKDEMNKTDISYNKLVGTVLLNSDNQPETEMAYVDFHINPTEYYDFNKFQEGRLSEKDLQYEGFSLEICPRGFGNDSQTAIGEWQKAIQYLEGYFNAK